MESNIFSIPQKPLKKSLNSKKLKWNLFNNSWQTKRLFLNMTWGILNLFILILLTSLILNSEHALIYIIGIFMYVSAYWIISASLFDFLIGNEVDEALK